MFPILNKELQVLKFQDKLSKHYFDEICDINDKILSNFSEMSNERSELIYLSKPKFEDFNENEKIKFVNLMKEFSDEKRNIKTKIKSLLLENEQLEKLRDAYYNKL